MKNNNNNTNNNNPYKCMHVLIEEEYQDFKKYKSGILLAAKCPIDGRTFVNDNVLAHHLKSHVNGYQCHICGKVFKYRRSLITHLKTHSPQVEVSNRSVLDDQMPNQPSASTVVSPAASTLIIEQHKKDKNHKQQRSVLNFTSKQWLTL